MAIYKVLDPHPKVLAQWHEMGYVPDHIEIEQGQMTALGWMGHAKKTRLPDPSNPKRQPEVIVTEAKEVAERPIKREVWKIYRVLADDDKEYLYYSEHLVGQSFRGTAADITRNPGKYKFPIYNEEIDRASGEKRILGVRTKESRYEIPFAKSFIDPSTGEKMTLEDLGKLRVRGARYYVRVGDAPPYEMLEMTYEDFISKPFSELLEYGKNLVRTIPVRK